MAAFAEVIEARFTRDGVESRGLDWADFDNTSFHQRKLFANRLKPTPEWALNDSTLRAVITAAMEIRAHLPRGAGLAAAQEEIERQRPEQIAIFWTLNKRYVRLKNRRWPVSRKRLKRLAREIESVDTFLRTTQHDGGAAILAATVYLYYRLGFDSVEVARELGLKPPHVRQILYRLARIAATNRPAWG